MTPGAREEAEKWDSGAVYSIQKEKPNMLYWVKWRDHVNQVEKARADAVLEFYDKVCKKAEGNMLKTGKLEGAHFAAMRTEIELIRNKLEKE